VKQALFPPGVMAPRGSSVPLLVLGAWLAIGQQPAHSQNLENGVINSFEINTAGSLEEELLNRLAATQQFQPTDLPWLARLTVLETIAMYQNARADLRYTSIGARLEGEMSTLWDAAQLFYVNVSYPPPDLAGLNRSRALLDDVGAAFRQVDATLGSLPGYSERAAFHLADLERLFPVMTQVFNTIDAQDGEPPPAPDDRAERLLALREQARRLSEDLRGLIGAVNAAMPAPADREGLVADLNGLLELVQGFDRTLSAAPSNQDLVAALRPLRDRVRSVEARIVRTPELSRRWQPVRQRFDALSDAFGLPRVFSLLPPERAPRRDDRLLVAQVDRAITALDEFLAQAVAGLRNTEVGSAFEQGVGRLRLNLLVFRQRAIAREPAGALARSLGEIEALNQELNGRANPDGRSVVVRGTSSLKAPGFRRTAEAVNRLRGLLPKG
jgi:hypothetical protein